MKNKIQEIEVVCAKLSNISYLSPMEIKDKLAKDFGPSMIFTDHNDFGMAVKTKDKFIIAFRGTDDRSDVISDINVIPLYKKKYGWIHRGVYNAAEELIGQVKNAIKYLNADNKPIYITGHSLGGAMACIAALMLENEGYHISGVITFGAPKCGKSGFKAKFQKEIVHSKQYMFDRDPVPKVPRGYMFWKHPGKKLVEPKFDEIKKSWWSWTWFGNPKCHSMDNYEKWIKDNF